MFVGVIFRFQEYDVNVVISIRLIQFTNTSARKIFPVILPFLLSNPPSSPPVGNVTPVNLARPGVALVLDKNSVMPVVKIEAHEIEKTILSVPELDKK